MVLIKAWYQDGNRKRDSNEEWTVPGVITLPVILAAPITAVVIATPTSMIAAVVISTGVMISSLCNKLVKQHGSDQSHC
jgi:hypothetical protein